jgi:hypothetical protein
MTNAEKYHFNDFTYEAYESLLLKAKETYTFSSYHNFDPASRFLLWRHDVDFSIHNALDFAEIENKNQVKSTYFLHLHSEFYHLLEAGVADKVRNIISLGHDIGLHFDTHFYNIGNVEQLEKYLLIEKNLLESIFGIEIKVFSFHNTNPFVLSLDATRYAGLINTYSKYFQKEIPYCSDSYGVWRFRRLKEVIDSSADHSLQVLTHPELWHKTVKSPIERVKNCIDGRARNTLSFYLNFLEKNGREIIDWN